MKDFKKKALILTLAATVSVTGSFAADNYKNCLMNMEFAASGDKEINLVLNTKIPYESTIAPIRKDAETYIIMLPEVDNSAPTPDLSETNNYIKSVEIRKMPYANGSKGYTKILIKTAGMVNLNTSTALYIPSKDTPQIPEIQQQSDDNARERQENNRANNYAQNPSRAQSQNTQSRYKNGMVSSSQARQYEQQRKYTGNEITQEPPTNSNNEDNTVENTQNIETDYPVTTNDSSHQKYMLGLLVLFIMMTSAYLYMRAQDKLTNVMGENLKIDVEDDKEEKKKADKKKHKISRTINKLDSLYSKTASAQIKPFLEPEKDDSEKQEEEKEELNVVDLDALFKEKQSASSENAPEEENTSTALDDFLSGFEFDDKELKENLKQAEEGAGYDEEEYEHLLKNKNITFSKDDIMCFNELLKSDISDDVVQNIDKYAISNPIKPQVSKEKILENLVTDYTIKQNLTFTSEDIDALKRLISVEIDPNFIYDLRTNHNLTDQIAESIQNTKVEHKSSKITTLNVKNALPNLTKELKKQGNRPIASEVKPETVYYSKGYEVSTLSVDLDLPDLSKEIKKKHAYDPKPSAYVDTVDNSYADSVAKLHISGLPDLNDAVAHPDKYTDKAPKETAIDEKALLNSILNVQFKPFDDGTRKFIIINDIEEKEETVSIPYTDIKEELNQFSNFEVADAEETEKTYSEPKYDDFEALYSQNYVDLDANKQLNAPEADTEKENSPEKQEPVNTDNSDKETNLQPEITKKYKKIKNNIKNEQDKTHKVKFIPKNLTRTSDKMPKRAPKEKSEKLINMLEKIRAERKTATEKTKTEISSQKEKRNNTKPSNIQPPSIVKCILDGVNYDVISSVAINTNLGCHLVKSDKGYKVLSYKDNDLSVLKDYESVKPEKIQARLSETLADGTMRYLIKTGLYKFLVDVNDNQIKYVMDLC